MRRFLPLTVCLLLPFASATIADGETEWGYSRIQVDGASYELRCRRIDVTLQHGWPGELFVYRVYRNGRFVRSLERESAGRFAGSVYHHQREASAAVAAEPFPDAEDPVGWMLLSGAICGNTFSRRVCLITVTEHASSYKDPDTYRETRFVSKGRPVLRRTGAGIEVWTSEQDWGGTGTWGSFMVPALRLVDREGRVHSRPLPPDLDLWPEAFEERWWLGVLVAGLREESPALMRTALDAVPWHADGTATLLKEHDLPRSPAAMEELVDTVDALAKARAEVDRLAGEYFPE